jgi:molecular chaperone HscB
MQERTREAVSDPFSTLGVPTRFDLDPIEIERAYRELQKALHPDRHVGKPAGERRIALSKAIEVNEAYRTVKDELSRARALLALRGLEAKDERPADPSFLMDVMERREELGVARTNRDVAAARRLGAGVRLAYEVATARVAKLFEDAGDPAEIAELLAEMRYHRRFLDEVRSIEEEAGA